MGEVQSGTAFAEIYTGKVSKMYCSGSCASVRARVQKDTPHLIVRGWDNMKPGDKLIWIKPSGLGHTGTVRKVEGDYAYVDEGNTTEGLDGSGKIERDGGGSYLTKRHRNGYGDTKVKMIVRPFA